MVHSWRRWRKHTKETPSQWGTENEEEATFKPVAAALAHYAWIRSTGGATAARGAADSLWRVIESVSLCFPFQESGVQGYNRDLRTHCPTKNPPRSCPTGLLRLPRKNFGEPIRVGYLRISLASFFTNDKRCPHPKIILGPQLQRMLDLPLQKGQR